MDFLNTIYNKYIHYVHFSVEAIFQIDIPKSKNLVSI